MRNTLGVSIRGARMHTGSRVPWGLKAIDAFYALGVMEAITLSRTASTSPSPRTYSSRACRPGSARRPSSLSSPSRSQPGH
jgi:hypothetical protein